MICLNCRDRMQGYKRKDGICDSCRTGMAIQGRIDYAAMAYKRLKKLIKDLEDDAKIPPGALKVTLTI